jgi:hypothetical protein
MVVSGWSNGSPNDSTGGGYGIKIRRQDRDEHFGHTWSSVLVELENGEVFDIGLSSSFWTTCPELRRKEIGKWMLDNGLGRWSNGRPHKFRLVPTGDRRFTLSRL